VQPAGSDPRRISLFAPKKLGGVERGPSPHAPDRATGTSLGCRASCNIATISGRLGKGRERSVEAKLCELDDKAFGPDFLGAAIEMIGIEILELGTVLEHGVDCGEERGRDGAGCLLWSTSTGKPMELGIEVAALLAPGGPGTLDQQGLDGWVRDSTGSFSAGLYSLAAFALMSAAISALWLDIRRPTAAFGVIRTAAQ